MDPMAQHQFDDPSPRVSVSISFSTIIAFIIQKRKKNNKLLTFERVRGLKLGNLSTTCARQNLNEIHERSVCGSLISDEEKILNPSFVPSFVFFCFQLNYLKQRIEGTFKKNPRIRNTTFFIIDSVSVTLFFYILLYRAP